MYLDILTSVCIGSTGKDTKEHPVQSRDGDANDAIKLCTSNGTVKMKKIDFDNDEAFQMTKEGFCEACKGQFYMVDAGCYESCEGFIEDYLETVEQLRIEDSEGV